MKLSEIHTITLNIQEAKKKKEKKSPKTKNVNTSVERAYEASGKSQEEIAASAKLDPSTISRYKSKEKKIQRKPSFDSLKALSKATGSKPSRMFPELG